MPIREITTTRMRKNERFAEGIEFHHAKFVLSQYYVGRYCVTIAVYNKTSKDPVILVFGTVVCSSVHNIRFV